MDNPADGPYHRTNVRADTTSSASAAEADRVVPVRRGRVALLVLALALTLLAAPGRAQDDTPRWRAWIVDTFNSRIGSPDDVSLVVTRAAALHANVVLVQVRRRGDAFYLDTSEPAPEGVTIEAGFDPLGDLLAKARTAGLEVHALVTLGPVWNQLATPSDPRHVFARHGFVDGRPIGGDENWLTRTPSPDGNGTSVDGYRFGNDFWLDFGHPAAASYVVDVLTRLVERYPVDGVHLDALQYPEPPEGPASVGYNDVAVRRFQQRVGSGGVPSADDSRWGDWRREQITALVRRLTVSLQAARPALIVSVGGVGAGPATGEWSSTIAAARALQDWLSWAGDGSVDAIVPQVYRAEHVQAEAADFATWLAWLREAPRARPLVLGLGAFVNSAEGLARQARAALSATDPLGGVSMFSLAANNAPVRDNPISLPPGRDTPQRPFEDMASILRTGRTTGGQPVDPGAAPLFAAPVPRPRLPWKSETGHVLGRVEDASGGVADGIQVRLDAGGRAVGPSDVVSDGSGVFAVPALPPGAYRVQLTKPDGSAYTSACTVDVTARVVTRVTLAVDPSRAGVALCR